MKRGTVRSDLPVAGPHSIKMEVKATTRDGLLKEAQRQAVLFFGEGVPYDLVWEEAEPLSPLVDMGTLETTVTGWQAEVWIRSAS